MRGALLVMSLGVAAACASPAPGGWLAGEVGGEPSEFVVLAGNWAIGEQAGERVLRLDGSQWTTGTPPTGLDAKAAMLFPSTAAAFAARVQAGLQFPYGVYRSVDTFSDGEIQVDFKLVGGVSDQFASILFGLNADGNHHAYRYNTKDGDTALWKVVDGQRERIHHGGVHLQVPLGEWRTLRMRVRGAEITGWVNDTQTLQFTLPAPVTGRIGLWSKADSVTDYRNYTVTR
jgi:hypothetical protein